MKLADMSAEQFKAKFGGVCEHSPWIAEAAFERIQLNETVPNKDESTILSDAFLGVITDAGEQRQLEFLCAHPELATALPDPGLAADSLAEQKGAGLNRCSENELAEFHQLNRAYREKFGFPFIVSVKRHDRASILDAFRKRIDCSRTEEFQAALEQVRVIVAMRILERLND
jgi:OHCU decarboxylase